jgi:hypothetical protein
VSAVDHFQGDPVRIARRTHDYFIRQAEVERVCAALRDMPGLTDEAACMYARTILNHPDSLNDNRCAEVDPTPALAVSAEPVDAEVVDDFDVYAPLSDQRDRVHTVTPDGDVWPPPPRTAPGTDDEDDSLNPFGPSRPPVDQLVSRADAYAAQADMRRRVAAQARAAGHATVRRTQRALPPGRPEKCSSTTALISAL